MTGKIELTVEDGKLVRIETRGRSGVLRIASNYLSVAAAVVDMQHDLHPGPIKVELNRHGNYKVTQ